MRLVYEKTFKHQYCKEMAGSVRVQVKASRVPRHLARWKQEKDNKTNKTKATRNEELKKSLLNFCFCRVICAHARNEVMKYWSQNGSNIKVVHRKQTDFSQLN